jgi:hypothetical protein
MEVDKFDDTTHEDRQYDIHGDTDKLFNNQDYPQDLENLIGFLRKNSVQKKTIKPIKTSGFCV